jgi:hypothetical protein
LVVAGVVDHLEPSALTLMPLIGETLKLTDSALRILDASAQKMNAMPV